MSDPEVEKAIAYVRDCHEMRERLYRAWREAQTAMIDAQGALRAAQAACDEAVRKHALAASTLAMQNAKYHDARRDVGDLVIAAEERRRAQAEKERALLEADKLTIKAAREVPSWSRAVPRPDPPRSTFDDERAAHDIEHRNRTKAEEG